MLFPNPKPGDEVAYFRSWRDEPRKLTIDRVTPTQVLVSGLRFSRKDGVQVGSMFDRAHIRPWTLEIEAEIEKRRVAERAAEHLRAVRNRGRAVLECLHNLDEAQAQAAESLVRELEQRVTDIMSRESALTSSPPRCGA